MSCAPFRWIRPLTELHARGFTDRRIADELNDLDPSGEWTPRRVRRLRKKLGLPPNAERRPEFRSAAAWQRIRMRVYAAKHGWGHLLPYTDEDRKEHVRTMTLGLRVVRLLDLRRREVDALTALADRGPLTADALGGLAAALGRLLRAGLVMVARRVPDDVCVVEEVYSLAPGVGRYTRTLRKLGVEERLGGYFRGGANLVRRRKAEPAGA